VIPELSDLAKQGPAWLLLVFAIGVIAYLYRQISRERTQSIEDFKTVIAGNTIQLKEQQSGNDARTRALEAHTRAMELMTSALNQLSSEVNRVSGMASDTMASNTEVVKALIKKGVDL
jgi:uncharacterized membrane protein